ncbi:hypothetical protein ACFVT5_17010 [Streptomyces sp. NPDC058001]|uniref:hypothetical protein n=1 Tax=Streptomyces sp. NPDC058001 TaxID=3346300 RepID=UPI0036EDAFBC
MAPLLFTALLGTFHSWVPLALYLAVAAAVTVVGLCLGRDADHAEEEDARLVGATAEGTDSNTGTPAP